MGYESRGSQTLSRGRQLKRRAQPMSKQIYPRMTRVEEIREVEMERSSSLVRLSASSQEVLISNRVDPDIIGIPNSLTPGTDFEAIIENIDKEIWNEGTVSDPVVTKIIKELNVAGKVAQVDDNTGQILVLEGVNESNVDDNVMGDICFSTGWTVPKNKNKGTKKPKEKGEGVLAIDRKEA
nr:hypothetical protein CFP56_56677 [Quercus suber]